MTREDERGWTGPVPVYLIHWRAPEWCASACRSLLASHGVRVDVAVIDNGPAQDTARLRSLLHDDVRLITLPTNAGFAAGANVALRDWCSRRPDGVACVIGSHDLHAEPHALAALVATLEQVPDAGVVAPVTTAPQATTGGGWTGTRAFQYGAKDVRRPSGRAGRVDGDHLIERAWTSGTCM